MLTCDRDQSLFLDPTLLMNNKTILQISYFVSEKFKQGLYDSCKDVTYPLYPGVNEKVMKLFCGACSPQKLLDYMGNTLNGYAPFDIRFPRKLTPNLHWMNKTILKCNESFFDLQNNRTANPCSCQDCTQSLCPVRQNESTNSTINPLLRMEQLVIRPTHPVPTGYHHFGDGKWIPFGPIFHLDLLNKVILDVFS